MAVMAASWYGGWKPGLFAVVLCVVAGTALFGAHHLHEPGGLLRVCLFVVVGGLVSFLSELMHRNRRRAEVRREALRVTLASMGDAVITTDDEGRVASLNPVAKALTGWQRGEAAGRPLEEVFRIVNEQTRQPVENPVKKVLALGQVVGLANHTVLIAKDGTERPIDDSAAPLRDAAGRITGVVLIFRDITERRRAEIALAERGRLTSLRAETATALATAPDGRTALQSCCEALVRHLDAAFARVWTLNETENALELQASAGLYTHLDGGHSRVQVGAFKIGRIAQERRPHLTNDVTHDPHVSDQAWAAREGMVAFAGYPLVADGRVVGVLALFARRPLTEGVLADLAPLAEWIAQYLDRKRLERQVAERNAAARQLAAIVVSSDDAIISKSLDGSIQSWNAAAERLFGYPAAQAVGRHVAFLIPTDRLAEEDEILARLRAGERIDHLETVRLRSDGQPVPVSLTVSPVRDEAGRSVGVATIVRDISKEKEAEARTYGLLSELREADRRKDEFLATLAHELRGPLAPLRNMLEVVKCAGGDDRTRQAYATMDRQLGQMTRLIDDLLDLSRISRGKVQLRRERVELASVVSQAVEACRALAASAGHDLAVTLPPEPLSLHADPVRLAQVFGNLLHNACKYTDPGGRITLTAERQGSDVVVRVKDSGVGIPPDQLASIFEMFTQVDESLERSQGGLGIGLSLVKRLVELHGGSVEAYSEGRGRGSEFVVRLPLLVEKPRAQQRPEPTAAVPPAPARRILVVDDNRDSAASLALLLSLSGHETHTAHDGLEAVEAAGEFRPDVVLLDIGLPKLNGYAAGRRIRELPGGEDMVLVALTGWGQEDDRRRSKEAGFDHHLVKPVDLAALQGLLAEKQPAPV